MSRFGTFTINGKDYDLDELDLDDVEEFETITGKEFGESGFSGGKAMKAMAFILLRRDDPTLTINDVGKVKLVAFAPPDEDMPDVGPPAEEAAENGSASEPAAAGALASVDSTKEP